MNFQVHFQFSIGFLEKRDDYQVFSVSDPPKVFLKFGSNINTEEIIENSDVYFDCIIDANPSIYKVEWHRNVSKTIVL